VEGPFTLPGTTAVLGLEAVAELAHCCRRRGSVLCAL
jgi:hypothetical protein